MSVALLPGQGLQQNHQILFTFDELACPKARVALLANGFDYHLLRLRTAYGRAMRLTSACRSSVYNTSIGGHIRSLHVYDNSHWLGRDGGCCAVDVAIGPGPDRHDLVTLAYDLGWSVGHASHFLHLDRRDMAGLEPSSFHYTR